MFWAFNCFSQVFLRMPNLNKITLERLPFWNQHLSRFFSEYKHMKFGPILCFLLWIITPALILMECFSMFFPSFCHVLFCTFPRQSIILVLVCNLLCETDILPLIYVKFLSTLIQDSDFPLVIICSFLCLLDNFCLRQALLVGWTSGDTTLAYRALLYDLSLLCYYSHIFIENKIPLETALFSQALSSY